MRIYLLTSFGGEYDDEWEDVEAVFSSYAAMTTWIKGKFEQVEPEFISDVHQKFQCLMSFTLVVVLSA